MEIAERPTDMLERQLQALRGSARYRHPETGRRSHLHCDWAIKPAVQYILAIRKELRIRRH